MATTSLSGLQALRLPELLVLIKRTAEWARNRRVLNPHEAMVPDEVKEAKVLYARAKAWPLGEPLRRAEPKWQKPGDVEAAFFALYDALRSKTWVRTRREPEEPNADLPFCRIPEAESTNGITISASSTRVNAQRTPDKKLILNGKATSAAKH